MRVCLCISEWGEVLRVLSAVTDWGSLFIQSATVSNWNEEILGWPMYTQLFQFIRWIHDIVECFTQFKNVRVDFTYNSCIKHICNIEIQLQCIGIRACNMVLYMVSVFDIRRSASAHILPLYLNRGEREFQKIFMYIESKMENENTSEMRATRCR